METNDYKNWLRYNSLESAQIKIFCERIKVDIYNSSKSENKIEYTTEEAWQLCAYAITAILPDHKEEVINVRDQTQVKFVTSKNNHLEQSYTLDQGKNNHAKINCIFDSTASSFLLMAHEFAHAVQLKLSYLKTVNGMAMPPVARECCAFIGELALIEYLKSENIALSIVLENEWENENNSYLGADLTVLAQASKNNQNYNYRWNYPIARAAAIELWKYKSLKRIQNLFCAAEQGMSFLPYDDLFKTPSINIVLPKVTPFNKKYKQLNRYQRLGIACLLDTQQINQKSLMSIDEYYEDIKQSIKNNTLFINYQTDKTPIAYAQVNSRDTDERQITIIHQSVLNGQYLPLITALKPQFPNQQIISLQKNSARKEQVVC